MSNGLCSSILILTGNVHLLLWPWELCCQGQQLQGGWRWTGPGWAAPSLRQISLYLWGSPHWNNMELLPRGPQEGVSTLDGEGGGFGGLIPGLKLTDGTKNILLELVQDAEWYTFELTCKDCGTKLSDKAALSFTGDPGWEAPDGRSDSQKPPAELPCPSLFPHLSCWRTAASQLRPLHKAKQKGIAVLNSPVQRKYQISTENIPCSSAETQLAWNGDSAAAAGKSICSGVLEPAALSGHAYICCGPRVKASRSLSTFAHFTYSRRNYIHTEWRQSTFILNVEKKALQQLGNMFHYWTVFLTCCRTNPVPATPI